MATLLFTDSVLERYKEITEVINSVEPMKKDVRVKTFKQMMQESFFHGASKFGDNFIA